MILHLKNNKNCKKVQRNQKNQVLQATQNLITQKLSINYTRNKKI